MRDSTKEIWRCRVRRILYCLKEGQIIICMMVKNISIGRLLDTFCLYISNRLVKIAIVIGSTDALEKPGMIVEQC